MKKILFLVISTLIFSLSNAEKISVFNGTQYDLNNFNCNFVTSSVLDRACYNSKDGIMVVQLKGKWYSYCSVSSYTFQNLVQAQSVGRYYNENVRGNFKCS
jgi:hypothetical protein